MALIPSQGWTKYAELSINNASIDYQMRLEIRRGSSQNNDPQQGIIYDDYNCYYDDLRDVRIGTSDDPMVAEQLPMWAEEVQTGIKRVLWIKTNGNAMLYLFVGNENAGEYSDGSATFPALFYDMSYDATNDWNYTVAVGDSTHRTHHWVNPFKNGISYAGARLRYRYKLNSINARNWASNAWIGLTAGDGNSSYPWGTIDESDSVYIVNYYNTDVGASETQPSCRFYSRKDAENYSQSIRERISGYLEGNYYIAEVKFHSAMAEYKLWEDGYAPLLKTYSLTSNIPAVVNKQFFAGGPHNTGNASIFEWINGYLRWKYQGSHYSSTDSWIEYYFYWIFVAKYTTPEPTWGNFGIWQNVGGGQYVDVLETGTGVDEIAINRLLHILEESLGLDKIARSLTMLIEEVGIGIDVIMKDGEIIIAEIGSIAEIISTQGMEDKLSNLHVKPARVVTTHFPAVAGLPSDKKIRIYAKAVSGQEKEIILEAIT